MMMVMMRVVFYLKETETISTVRDEHRNTRGIIDKSGIFVIIE